MGSLVAGLALSLCVTSADAATKTTTKKKAEKKKETKKKETKKTFMSYSGWKGGEKYRSVAQVRAKNPEKLITHAVRGMVPKNRLGRVLMTKLKVYKGDKHPHAAQQPETMAVAK